MRKTYHTFKAAVREHNTAAFKTGLVILIINPFIGWGGSALAVLYFSLRHQVKLGIMTGSAIYVFSWLLLGLGMLLTGKPGYRISRQVLREIRQRLRHRKTLQVTEKDA